MAGPQHDDSLEARAEATTLVLRRFALMAELQSPEARQDWILSLTPETYDQFLVELNSLARGNSVAVDDGQASYAAVLSSPPRALGMQVQAQSLRAAQTILRRDDQPLSARLESAALVMSGTQVLTHVRSNGNGRLSRLFGYAVACGYPGMRQAKDDISAMIERSSDKQPFRPFISQAARRAAYRMAADHGAAMMAQPELIPDAMTDGPANSVTAEMLNGTGLRPQQQALATQLANDPEPIGKVALAMTLERRGLLTDDVIETVEGLHDDQRVFRLREAFTALGPDGVDEAVKLRGLMAAKAVSNFVDQMVEPTQSFMEKGERTTILESVTASSRAASTPTISLDRSPGLSLELSSAR